MKRISAMAAGIAAALTAASAQAQTYAPLPPENPLTAGIAFDRGQYALAETGVAAPPANALSCATPPSLSDLSTLKVTNNVLSANAASSLGFPLGSVDGSGAGRVLVQDWSRTASCLARDGKTELVYGQAIRVVASADQLDAEAGVTLPIIAAHATLNRATTNIQAQVIGFNDPTIYQLAAQLLGTIDVTTFETVNRIISDIAAKAPGLSGGSVVRLGVNSGEPETSHHVIAAFAVQQIADGRSCLEARRRFPGLTAAQTAAMDGVYQALMLACDNSAPDPVSRARADAALMGVRVRR